MAISLVDPGNYSERGYIAPTVYLLAGRPTYPRWNYYNNLQKAAAKAAFLASGGTSGTDYNPDGEVDFRTDGTAQTAFINVDFYLPDSGQWTLINYATIKQWAGSWPQYFIGMGYTPDGNGPVYFIIDPQNLGVSATSVNTVDPDTLAALDGFYREVTLLKYRYNSLAGFLNNLSQRTLNPTEQQIFNEGNLKLQAMAQEINQIQGIAITFTDKGTIGNPLLLIILLVLILAGVTAWAITDILNEEEKTKRINDAYQLNEWVADKKTQLAQMVTAGQLTQSDANNISSGLDKAAAAGLNVAQKAASSTSMLDGLTNLVKWGVGGFIVFKLFDYIGKRKGQN